MASSLVAFSMTVGAAIGRGADAGEIDFLQRIACQLRSRDTLEARIEGTIDGRDRAVDFPMRPIDCQAGIP